ncbi:MAG: 50S ribosomal protein L32 [Chloroflexi bacterium]|nr:50S ribosomal protein L32 [Chloroflexota bacterium]
MTPHPKQKISKGRRDRRRAHDALRRPHLITCPTCKNKRPPHQVCPYCGTYRGRTVVEIEEESGAAE